MRRMKAEPKEDKKSVARLNEILVLTTLARSGNDPMYVSRIKKYWPIVHDLDDDEVVGFTKQGIKAACERLVEYGILKKKDRPAPKRTGGTPHYWIKKDLDTLFKIDEKCGTYALDEVRNSLARNIVNEETVVEYLAKQLTVGPEDILKAGTEEVKSITTMARSSTRALKVFLSYTRPLASTPEESRAFDLKKAVEKLRVLMVLEFLLDLLGDKRTVKPGWNYDVEIKADISRGKAAIGLRTRLTSTATEG